MLLLYISKVSECRRDCASVNVNVPTHTDVALPKRLVFFEQELNRGLQWFVLSGYNNSGAFVLLLSPLIVAFVRSNVCTHVYINVQVCLALLSGDRVDGLYYLLQS